MFKMIAIAINHCSQSSNDVKNTKFFACDFTAATAPGSVIYYSDRFWPSSIPRTKSQEGSNRVNVGARICHSLDLSHDHQMCSRDGSGLWLRSGVGHRLPWICRMTTFVFVGVGDARVPGAFADNYQQSLCSRRRMAAIQNSQRNPSTHNFGE